ncbi:hypothetical protein HDU76_005330 [Blyttiomyces sp. JEL0837]|nr:hypothetical protein HDU76_005330 [Blyttiomyces sp. JEL0837]
MCGRTVMALAPDTLQHQTRATNYIGKDQYRKSYNVGPGRGYPVLYKEVNGSSSGSSQRVLRHMRWGLIPTYGSSSASKSKPQNPPDFPTILRTINARDDSIRENAPTWLNPRVSQRCLIPVQGFFEWLKKGKDRKPYYIHPSNDDKEKKDENEKIMYFAGLYNRVMLKTVDGPPEEVYSFTIVTTESSSRLKWLHDRMPVILSEWEDQERWLDPFCGWTDEVEKLMRPVDDGYVWHAVSPFVNKVGNDTPECIVPIEQKRGTLSHFLTKSGSSISGNNTNTGISGGVKRKLEEKEEEQETDIGNVGNEDEEGQSRKMVRTDSVNMGMDGANNQGMDGVDENVDVGDKGVDDIVVRDNEGGDGDGDDRDAVTRVKQIEEDEALAVRMQYEEEKSHGDEKGGVGSSAGRSGGTPVVVKPSGKSGGGGGTSSSAMKKKGASGGGSATSDKKKRGSGGGSGSGDKKKGGGGGGSGSILSFFKKV